MDQSISSLPSIFRRHRLPALAAFASVICGSLVYLISTPPMYQVTARIMLTGKQVSVSGGIGNDLSQDSGVQYASPIATQSELARSQQVLQQALDEVSLQGIEDLPDLETLRDELKVSTLPGTAILELRYRSGDPLLTSGLLNAVVESLIKENGESFRSNARSVRRFLEAELPEKRVQLTQAETAESEYQKSSNVVYQTQSLGESLAQLEEQERALSAQLQEASVRDSRLQQTTNSGTLKKTYAAVRSGQDEELKLLRARLADLEADLVVKRTRLTDNNPVLLTLLEQRNATRALYTRKLSRLLPSNDPTNRSINIASDDVSQNLATRIILGEVERSGLESKLTVVRNERAKLQSLLNELPAKRQTLAALTRRREAAASSVELLQSRLEEARIAEAQLESTITIIERAEPPTAPNWPNKRSLLVVANAAGVILAIGIVMLLEVIDGTVRNATEAEQLVKLPVLGVLPVLPTIALNFENSESFLNQSKILESYRKLLKTMELRSIEDLDVVVVSSTLSGEGKSVVASHLAGVSAMLSRRTLIIDTDLRCPAQHKTFNLAVQPGLTDVIDGDVTLAEAVQPTGIKNLSVLSSGELRAQPSQFLESASMATLLAEAAAHYDLIIVDTPPITSGADATTLSSNSSGMLLVVRPMFTPRDILLRAVSELTDNKVSILGVAINGINTQTENYYRYPMKSYHPLQQLNRVQRLLRHGDE